MSKNTPANATTEEEIDCIAAALKAAVNQWDQDYAGDCADDDAHISLQKSIDADGDVSWSVEIMSGWDDQMTHWKNGEGAAADIAMICSGDALSVAREYYSAWDEDFTEDARPDADEDEDEGEELDDAA